MWQQPIHNGNDPRRVLNDYSGPVPHFETLEFLFNFASLKLPPAGFDRFVVRDARQFHDARYVAVAHSLDSTAYDVLPGAPFFWSSISDLQSIA
jgi:hypothetical protein